MRNKTFIIVLISVISVGTIATGTLFYLGNNKNIATVEHVQTEQILTKPTKETKQVQELETKETWQKVGNGLYFDTKTANIQSDYIEGTFKQHNHNSDTQDGKIYAYKTIGTGAYCDIKLQDGVKKLEYPIYSYYDFYGKLLSEENIHKTWAKEYPNGHLGITHLEDVENGKIYFKTLCKYFK